jgi:hypothetical protein
MSSPMGMSNHQNGHKKVTTIFDNYTSTLISPENHDNRRLLNLYSKPSE